MSKGFAIGFTGATLDAILPWAGDQVGDTDTVVMAMAGSGKDIAYLAREGRTIYSWDPQPLSRYVVHGVFSEPAELPPALERGGTTGYATEHTPIRGIPLDAATLADHIATTGSDYDRVCLARALIGSTYMGRLSTWARDATADTLWGKYLKAHAGLAAWRGLPGTFVHVQGSVFADPWFVEDVAGAVLYIDTPKVIQGGKNGDIYSKGWAGLNSILAQAPIVLPPWNRPTFERDMPTLWRAPYRRMLLFHTTGAQPDVPEVAAAMHQDGVPAPTSVVEWVHKGRADVCWVVDR